MVTPQAYWYLFVATQNMYSWQVCNRNYTEMITCSSGSMTITDFVLLSLVIVEDSGMLDRNVGEILNNIQKTYYTIAVDEL